MAYQRISRGKEPTAVARSPLKAQRLQHQRSSGQKTQHLSFPPHALGCNGASQRHPIRRRHQSRGSVRVQQDCHSSAATIRSAPRLRSAVPACISVSRRRSISSVLPQGLAPRFTDPGHRSPRRIPSMPQSPRSVEQAGGIALVNEPWWCRALKCVEKRGVFRLLPTGDSISGGHRRSMSYTVPFFGTLSCSGSLAGKNGPKGTNNPNPNTRQKKEAEGEDVHMREKHTNTYNWLRECTHDQQ